MRRRYIINKIRKNFNINNCWLGNSAALVLYGVFNETGGVIKIETTKVEFDRILLRRDFNIIYYDGTHRMIKYSEDLYVYEMEIMPSILLGVDAIMVKCIYDIIEDYRNSGLYEDLQKIKLIEKEILKYERVEG